MSRKKEREPAKLVRLQKFLAECGVASRRGAEELISEGQIRVNGEVVTTQGVKIDPERDRIDVNGKIVRPDPKGIVLLYKPRAVVSTLFDPEGRPALSDYLGKKYRSFFPVGRLDYDSSGLIILTNDGDLAEYLLHPRYQFERVYKVKVGGGTVDERTIAKLSRGVRLDDGIARAEAEVLSNEGGSSWLLVRVREGRNRLIRRMMEKIHHPVDKLVRVGHGPFSLGKLKPGGIRTLSEREYLHYRQKVLNGVAREQAKREGGRDSRSRRSGSSEEGQRSRRHDTSE